MKRPRFLTLTFKSKHHLTKDWRRWQAAALRKFLKHRWVKEHIGGGVWAWEVTYNARLKMWHPHFHILFDGDYLPRKQVKEIWREIADGAFIVDVEEVKGAETEEGKRGALRETIKYITKAIAFTDNADLLKEFLTATKGMRRIGVFGKYHGYKPPKPDAADDRHWNFDPFTMRGPSPIRCRGCGFEAMPFVWNRLRGLFSEEEAAWLARNRGDPDPAVLLDEKLKRSAAEGQRELTFEEVFGE